MSNNTFITQELRNKIHKILNSYTIYYISQGRLLVACPDPKQWTPLETGFIVLSKNPQNIIQIIFIEKKNFTILLIHELYLKFSKVMKIDFEIISFPSELCVIGIQFKNQIESKNFAKEIDKVSPSGGSSFSLFGIFKRKEKPMAISSPQDVTHQSGANWDPECGFEISGSTDGLMNEQASYLVQNSKK